MSENIPNILWYIYDINDTGIVRRKLLDGVHYRTVPYHLSRYGTGNVFLLCLSQEQSDTQYGTGTLLFINKYTGFQTYDVGGYERPHVAFKL